MGLAVLDPAMLGDKANPFATPLEILPEWLQIIAKILPLVHIFEEMRNILINGIISYTQIFLAITISIFYFALGVAVFYISYAGAKIRGTLINVGE